MGFKKCSPCKSVSSNKIYDCFFVCAIEMLLTLVKTCLFRLSFPCNLTHYFTSRSWHLSVPNNPVDHFDPIVDILSNPYSTFSVPVSPFES